MSREGDATKFHKQVTDGPQAPEEVRRAAGFLARRLYQAYTAAWARQVDSVLTSPQFAVLSTVEAHPEVDQGTLAASVALDRSTMADVCRRLEDRGLISRSVAPSDARRKLLTLTDQGADALASVRARVAALEAELFDTYDDNRGRLIDDLAELSETWEAVAATTRTA